MSVDHEFPFISHHPNIEWRLVDHILTIIIGRPDTPHGVTVNAIKALHSQWDALAWDERVRVVVLRSKSAEFGWCLDPEDVQEMKLTDPASLRAALHCLTQWRTRTLHLLPQVVVAVVDGACAGAMRYMLEGCDIVLAAENAQFSSNVHDNLWLERAERDFPERCSMNANSRPPNAMSDSSFNGKNAEIQGTVTLSYPPDQLENEVQDLTRALSDKDPLAIKFTKETLAHVHSMSWDASLSFTAAKFAEIKSLQGGGASSRAAGVASFLAGQSKPGLSG